jgi:hypothetical protein
MKSIRTILSTALIAGLAIVIMSAASFAASEFEGVWAVKDSKDRPFEITLLANGRATSTQEKAKEGTWKEEGGAAVITWTTGWTTKIIKEGDHYIKAVFKKGVPLDGPPSHKSDAVKK